MTKDTALRMALEALETVRHKIDSYQVNVCDDVDEAITAIREALAPSVATNDTSQERVDKTSKQRHEQEPVVWMYQDKTSHAVKFQRHMSDFVDHSRFYETPLYTTPQQRKSLTDEEIWKFWWSRPEVAEGEDDSMEAEFVASVRRVLAAHGIKE